MHQLWAGRDGPGRGRERFTGEVAIDYNMVRCALGGKIFRAKALDPARGLPRAPVESA
jgi:hypothetical protein